VPSIASELSRSQSAVAGGERPRQLRPGERQRAQFHRRLDADAYRKLADLVLLAARRRARLELGAMCTPAPAASDDFVGNSVHVSTKNPVDTSILKRSAAFKVPRVDAYGGIAQHLIERFES